MSKKHSRNSVFVDVGLLRDHISNLREEKKTAMELYNRVRAMRDCSDPALYSQYHSVFRDIDLLIEYFERMAFVLSHAGDEATMLSREIGDILDENADRTQHQSLNSFML